MKNSGHYWDLAGYLSSRRKKKGLTQKEVSLALGYATAQFISNFERGKAVPPLGKVPKLVKILGLHTSTYVDLYLRGMRRELAEKLSFKVPKKAWDKYKSPK